MLGIAVALLAIPTWPRPTSRCTTADRIHHDGRAASAGPPVSRPGCRGHLPVVGNARSLLRRFPGSTALQRDRCDGRTGYHRCARPHRGPGPRVVRADLVGATTRDEAIAQLVEFELAVAAGRLAARPGLGPERLAWQVVPDRRGSRHPRFLPVWSSGSMVTPAGPIPRRCARCRATSAEIGSPVDASCALGASLGSSSTSSRSSMPSVPPPDAATRAGSARAGSRLGDHVRRPHRRARHGHVARGPRALSPVC